MIKILIVDDSTFIRKLLRQMLVSDPEIEVVGESGDGREAVDRVHRLKPDVVTMDIIMPGVDGVWALEEIMKQQPTPVVIVSSVGVRSSDIMSVAFSLGVVDVVLKPDEPQNLGAVQKELIAKVKAAAKVSKPELILQHTSTLRAAAESAPVAAAGKPSARLNAHQAVAIISSAGGPVSLYQVLSNFSKDFHGGVIIAQHMPQQFVLPFVKHLSSTTDMEVKLAEKGDILYSRRVLFSPTSATLNLTRTKKGAVVDLSDLKKRLQPDFDSVVISCAQVFKSAMTLITLSGLGNDGVKGAEEVKRYGGKVIVENETTAGVFNGMPASVIASGHYDVAAPAQCLSWIAEGYLSGKQRFWEKSLFVNGFVLDTICAYIADKYSAEFLKDIIKDVCGDFGGVKNGHCQYCSSEKYYRLLEGINNRLQTARPEIIVEIGSAVAKACISKYAQALNITDLTDVLKFVEIVFRMIYPGIKGEMTEFSVEKKQAVLSQKSVAFDDNSINLSNCMTKGWVTYIFTSIGLVIDEYNYEVIKNGNALSYRCLIKWK